MYYWSTYPEVSSDGKSMMDLDSSLSEIIPQEVFTIGDRGAASSNHDYDPANLWNPTDLTMGNNN